MPAPALMALALVLALPGAGAGDCSGQRRVLRGPSGVVSDGPGNYSVNGNCEWLVEAPSPRHRVLLSFSFMDTECSYDYLFVYDGGTPRSPLLASLSGSSLPPPLEATSGKMLLHLFSDANYNLLGFNASFRLSLCPGGCSGRGRCDPRGVCRCPPGWAGADCSLPPCAEYCTPPGGVCDQATGRCRCLPGFLGRGCELSLGDNRGGALWYRLSDSDPRFPPRAAAAGAVLPTLGGLLLFGGHDLNQALGDLLFYNFSSNSWEQLGGDSPGPAPRHSHVAVCWQDSLVLSGGQLAGGALADDVWQWDPRGGSWQELSPQAGPRPPGLAAHAAALVDDDWLYIFGGRTATDAFSSALFRFSLGGRRWERVEPWGGKAPAAAGHSMVFHPPSRSLVVFGGHRPATARFSTRVNSTDLFHVDQRHWTSLRAQDGHHGPRERAFHTATLIGDYMVVFGGNVHIHYHEEKCYEDQIFFYHLGCHQWVPAARLAQGLQQGGGSSAGPGRGRFSHVAAVLAGRVLLVGGGFSGAPRGDLLAFKVPGFVFQLPAHDHLLDFCSLYADPGTCTQDPQCGWCRGGCRSPSPRDSCPSSGCLGLARLLGDCESCLIFGGGSGPGPPHSPGPFGWCVQNETCMPLAERGRCRVGQISGTFGWWGPEAEFLSAPQRCRSHNLLPGLHLLTFQHPRNDSQPDKVSLVRSTTITLSPGGSEVSLQYRGFIHPLLGPPHPPGPGPRVWARSQRLDVVARMGRGPDSAELEEVGRWWGHPERETRPLLRPRPEQLFRDPGRGNRYRLELEGRLNGSGGGGGPGGPGGLSAELTLLWDRTGVPGGSEISFFFLEPLRSPPGQCPRHRSCLGCLGDQGCGWCPPSASCHGRLHPPGGLCGPGGPRLVLAPSHCPLCEEHRDCRGCAEDPFCEWQTLSGRKGDVGCGRRGRQEGAVRDPQLCPKLCSERRSCQECLANSSQCAWCQSTQRCFLFASYLAKYPHGECRGWSDSVHSAPQCPQCPLLGSCRECLRTLGCGWCADSDSPPRGRCLEGDFSGVWGFPNCSVALGDPRGSSSWSYERCPALDECQLGLARCHPNASCHNTPEAFECRCRRGFHGDGIAHCEPTCYDDCGHGHCSGPPDYTCLCQLGWTSPQPNASLGVGTEGGTPPGTGTPAEGGTESGSEPPPVARCSLDCGCHLHSSCELAGPGVCDQCHNLTTGAQCQLCQPGSFGDALSAGGCRQCQCHGHGDPARGLCHPRSGLCFCSAPTRGPHCQHCAPGHYGDPRAGGLCYRECGGRWLLPNVSSPLALGSRPPAGGEGPGGDSSHCLWLLSVTGGPEPCAPGDPCPILSLTLQPGAGDPCQGSFSYAFDGVPAFLDGGALEGDPSLLGAFCGAPPEPLTLEAHSGVLVLYHEGNGTGGGFNATVGVRPCPHPPCPRGGGCGGQGGEGPAGGCGCPQDCGEQQGRGSCDQALGLCVCSEGWGGPACAQPLGSGGFVWEQLDRGLRAADSAGRFLQRLGHSLVPGPGGSLWMFGGLSLAGGLLSSVYRFSIPERRWTQLLVGAEGGGPGPPPRAFHAAAALPGTPPRMLVVGGLTPAGVAADVWTLDLSTLQWSQQQDPQVPPVAGHTLTPCGSSLLLIGGFAPRGGFNQRLLRYGEGAQGWQELPQAGTPPTGLYGHSAVFHPPSDAAFVFGGLRFHVDAVGPSPELYALHCPSLRWSLLAPARGHKPQPHYFHAAAVLGDLLVVVGGRTPAQAFSAELLLYHLRCNAWMSLDPRGASVVGQPVGGAVAQAVAEAGGHLYISGGFNGAALGGLWRLRVPPDPCQALLDPQACARAEATCAWCQGSCLGTEEAQRRGCGPGCFPAPRDPQDCGRLRSCSECLAQHPRSQDPPPCKWCSNCPWGACVGTGGSCGGAPECRLPQRQLRDPRLCPEAACGAPDCASCGAKGGCVWTRQFKRTGETRRILSLQPSYDWTCFSRSLLSVSPLPVEAAPPLPCPRPCHDLGSCSLCLASKGADGGWHHCVWSPALQECLSPSWAPLRCLAGGCGGLLRAPGGCGAACGSAPRCARCLRLPGCGWCARRGQNGSGRCVEGGPGGPRHGLAQACGAEADWAFLSCPPEDECANGHHNCGHSQECQDLPQGYRCQCRAGYSPNEVTGQCQPVCERGCANGTCVEPNRCRCHFGFVGPDCAQPCDCNGHSQCQGPSARQRCLQCHNNTAGPQCQLCRPLFVGSARAGGTCRPCQAFCGGHAEVCVTRQELERARRDPQRYPLEPALVPTWVSEGPSEAAAVCVGCQDHSVGERCQGCQPGYFLLDGHCTRCQCNGHADSCNEQDGTGCPCQNNTESPPCPGTPGERRDCYKQQCSRCRDSFQGHPVGGGQCYRLLAVEQEYCLDPSSQSGCFHPPQRRPLPAGRAVLFGVQPKFTNVDIRVTLDVTFGAVDLYVATSYDTFAVDVEPTTGWHLVRLQGAAAGGAGGEGTAAGGAGDGGGAAGGGSGGAEGAGEGGPGRGAAAGAGPGAGLGAGPAEDGAGSPAEAGAGSDPTGSGPAGSGGPPRLREEQASGLVTYLTLRDPAAALVVRGVRDRLVLTFPHTLHPLKSSRFYLLVLGVGGPSGGPSQGLLFFRQDQAHIDLFVFFSVFFSCFFLFLALCVLLWKAKQGLDARQEQRRQLQEMTKMASRPFARVTVCFQGCPPRRWAPPVPAAVPAVSPAAGAKSSAVAVPPAVPAKTLRPPVPTTIAAVTVVPPPVPGAGPVTLEPTEDGVAAVATLLLQLPGGPGGPHRAALASALVTLRQGLLEFGGGPAPRKGGGGGGLAHELTSMAL